MIHPEVRIEKVDWEKIEGTIERAGRVCYKSEDKIDSDSKDNFIRSIIRRGHESVIEHRNFSVLFVIDRGVSHELVRHRLASYSQESTRYCNYTKEKFDSKIIFIKNFYLDSDSYELWLDSLGRTTETYFRLIESGVSPQIARSVLPNSLKTEVFMTANIREWRHILKLRTSKAAHPQIREVMTALLLKLREKSEILFGDLEVPSDLDISQKVSVKDLEIGREY